MSKLKIIAAAALIAATFAGCGARSNGKSYVKSRVDLVFDGAQYVKRGETVDMSDEDKKLIGRDKNSFYPVYYSPASNYVPSTDEMTKEIPRYER